MRAGFCVALKEFDSTEKHQHTLQDLVIWGVFRLVLRVWKRLRVSEAYWCSFCGSHVLHGCHHSDGGSSLDDRVGVG